MKPVACANAATTTSARDGVQGVTLNNFPLIGQYHGVTYLDPEPMRSGNDAARMRRMFDPRFIPNREAS